MFYPIHRFFLFLIAISFLVLTPLGGYASGSKAEGEAKEAEKSEGGGEKKEEKKAKSEEDSFILVQHRVQTFEAKIHSGKEELEKLVREKRETKNPERVATIIKEMIKVHKEIEKNIKEYDLQRSLLKYRYPEKGRSDKREYERIELDPLESVEGQVNLATDVKHTLKKIRSQYETPAEALENEKASTPKRNITDPFVLKK
jgi:hypothetical protein